EGGASTDVETRHLEREVERLAGEIEQRQTELARVQESAARALIGQGISEGTELFRRELEREIAPYEQALEQAIRQQSGAAQRLSALTAASGGGGDGARAPELTEDQKRIQQAVADISREFRLLEEQAAVPGREMDLFAEKQKVLNSAIDDLIQDNFTVGGGGIQFILERFGKYLEEAGDEVEESGKDLADKIRNVTAGDPSRSGLELTAYQGGQSLGQTGGGGLFAPSPPTTGSTAGPGFGAELMGELGGFAGIMSTAAEATEGFGGELMGLVGALGPMGVAVATVNQMLEGLMQIMGPIITAIFEPLGTILGKIGAQIANTLLPVLEWVAPTIQIVAQLLETLVMPRLQALAPVIEFLGWLYNNTVVPALKALATVVEIVMAPIEYFGDRMEWLGENIGVLLRNLVERVKTFGHNLGEILSMPREAINVLISWLEAFGKNIQEVINFVTSLGTDPIKKHKGDSFKDISADIRNPNLEDYGDFESDAFSGLGDRIRRIWDTETPDFTPGEFDSGGGVHGGNTTVQRAPDIYATLNFHGPIIGESGMVEVGEFFVEGVQAYLGAGGEVQFLEAR
ncbi:MAG: phage tail protein, partial [Spirochaetota bacterium]